MQSMKAATQASSGGKPSHPKSRWSIDLPEMSFSKFSAIPTSGLVPFAAKVLVTLRDERIRLTTEAELTRVIEDVNQYLEQVA
jgi:hypothetical protein